MGGFQTTRIIFSFLTIITLLFVVCLRQYLLSRSKKLKKKTEDDEQSKLVIKGHEIAVRFRSREYVILSLIFLIEIIFLIEDLLDDPEVLTSGTTWTFTLIQLQLLLVWFIQEQRQISEINMILRILSLSFTLFFGWIFVLFYYSMMYIKCECH